MIGSVLPIVAPIMRDVLSSLFPDKEKAQEAEHKMMAALLAADKGQVHINQVEARHASLFVAGWRPWLGWVCGMGIFWSFVLQPVALWLNGVMGWHLPMPPIETGYLVELVMAMLGLGGLRSFEKVKGVAR
ncbi:MAG: hypothetical protein GDA54_01700 [Alphaproteobacteria bacterium GM7ARS4]|nr:hypothetical protein [Alphaproteobacteria bacterium GM7ARS4]